MHIFNPDPIVENIFGALGDLLLVRIIFLCIWPMISDERNTDSDQFIAEKLVDVYDYGYYEAGLSSRDAKGLLHAFNTITRRQVMPARVAKQHAIRSRVAFQ